MFFKSSDYEATLADYSNAIAAIDLLKQYRPYLEMIPSMRRPDESIVTIPLPVARIRNLDVSTNHRGTTPDGAVCLPCDLAILMCDPEWKIKVGAEILVFIHRPHEDFSGLLGRWRQTQVWLDKDYEWLMPLNHQHILSETAEKIYPLFVVFEETPERVMRGLQGAGLPFVVQVPTSITQEEAVETLSPESPSK